MTCRYGDLGVSASVKQGARKRTAVGGEVTCSLVMHGEGERDQASW